MKKPILLLILLLMFSLVGCNANNQSEKNSSSNVPVENNETKDKAKEEVKEEVKTVAKGETISTESAEILINNVELTYDVLPDKTDGFYTHYPAESGKVYINVDVDVKNMQKQNLECDSVMNVKATYNGGYEYNAQPIVEDSTTGFTYSNITSITPLETKGMRYLIDCPQEVEESKNPLVLTFELNGEKYNYTIR
ncbi:TPA: hypothetical protein JRS25_003670 [Escherichia coli]|nr:hypothetical protein [Escherichia coli]HAY3976949.1 hypothetical protein [Escherichia coli]HBB9210919.1 hypothetical protein [Escherichia coli]